jgi:cadmium resistance protein CadD (predicted permease)
LDSRWRHNLDGGDNIGVYIPAFAACSAAKLAGVAAVFLILVAVWCVAAYTSPGTTASQPPRTSGATSSTRSR